MGRAWCAVCQKRHIAMTFVFVMLFSILDGNGTAVHAWFTSATEPAAHMRVAAWSMPIVTANFYTDAGEIDDTANFMIDVTLTRLDAPLHAVMYHDLHSGKEVVVQWPDIDTAYAAFDMTISAGQGALQLGWLFDGIYSVELSFQDEPAFEYEAAYYYQYCQFYIDAGTWAPLGKTKGVGEYVEHMLVDNQWHQDDFGNDSHTSRLQSIHVDFTTPDADAVYDRIKALPDDADMVMEDISVVHDAFILDESTPNPVVSNHDGTLAGELEGQDIFMQFIDEETAPVAQGDSFWPIIKQLPNDGLDSQLSVPVDGFVGVFRDEVADSYDIPIDELRGGGQSDGLAQ